MTQFLLCLVTMTGAWYGGVTNGGVHYQDSSLQLAIFKAMDWWFAQDFTNPDCLSQGGTDICPCGTPGLWNTNWFANVSDWFSVLHVYSEPASQVIAVPSRVAQTCLLFGPDVLDGPRLDSCIRMTSRSYYITGYNTGANLLDIASIGVNLALLTSDVTILADAYQRIHAGAVTAPAPRSDGVHADGSFASVSFD